MHKRNVCSAIMCGVLVVLLPTSAFSGQDIVGELGSYEIKRFYDEKTGVVCYQARYDTLSCVYLPARKPEQKNEDVPE